MLFRSVKYDSNINGNLVVLQDANIYGNTYVYSNLIVTYDSNIYGNLVVLQDANVYGNINAYSNLNVTYDSTVYGNLTVYGKWYAKDIFTGDEIEIQLLDKTKILLTVPEGTESGKVLRISGKGVPHFNGFGKGNLYVELKIKTPRKLSKEQRKVLEDLKKVGL